MLAAWRAVTARGRRVARHAHVGAPARDADRRTAGRSATTFGNRSSGPIYHYWFHTGENQAIRQQLGHERLPQFVGNIDTEAPYRPEWRTRSASAPGHRRDDVDVGARPAPASRAPRARPPTNTLRWVRIDGPASSTRFADARDLAVEVRDHLRHGRPARLDPPLRAREQRDEAARQVDVGHRRGPAASVDDCASTDQIGGRLSAISDHVRPSSAAAVQLAGARAEVDARPDRAGRPPSPRAARRR